MWKPIQKLDVNHVCFVLFEQKNVEERLRQHLKISDVAVEEPPPLESSESEEEEEEEVEERLPEITDEMDDVSNLHSY